MKANWVQLQQFLLNLITKGRHKTYDVEVTKKIIRVNLVMILGIGALLMLGTIKHIDGINNAWFIDYTVALALFLNLLYIRQSQNYWCGLYTGIVFFTVLCYYLLFTGGVYQTGYVWCFTYPLIASFGLGSRKGLIAAGILIIPTLILFTLANPPGIAAAFSLNFKIWFVCTFLIISAITYIVARGREVTRFRLERKNAQLNNAMFNLRTADEELRKASEELEKRVEERTQQLSAANRQLLEEMKERRQAEASLRQSEEKYRLITDNTADIICILDLNLRFTYISPSVFRVRGYAVEEAMEQTFEQVMAPGSLQKSLDVFEEEMKLEESGNADPGRIMIIELEEYKKDGSTIWLEISVAFLRNNDKKAVGILAVSRDINERKRAEAEKNNLEEQLKQAQKLEAIGTLAGGIAHDFNNLLMGIQGNVSLIQMDTHPSHPHYERLKQIEQQVDSGANLTSQLLGFARKGRYEVKPTDINRIIDKTSSMFGRTKKEITLSYRLEPNLWPINADQGQIEQVLMNLYVNAAHAMPAGGELSLSTENVLLNDDYERTYAVKKGRYVKLSIGDTGTGMEERILKRIFDPFFTTKAMGRGTGLGLSMVYGIITGHEGIINVKSQVGQGTTFHIYLPASEMTIQPETKSSTNIIKGTGTILLVDDEPMVLEVNRELLSSLGYRVYLAGSGQEAIAVYLEKQKVIDLIILDMIMPGISGGATFDRLRAINPNIPVLLSSGYSLESEAKQILERGCNDFIQKPFSFEKLSCKVHEILDS